MTSRSLAFWLLPATSIIVSSCSASSPLSDGEHFADDGANLVDKVVTVDGEMDLEDDYVPRVCTQENGAAPFEALKAQAIAARTYVLRAMRDDDDLGTAAKPIQNSQGFQAYSDEASPACVAAAKATRGVVARYKGELVIANYVAGAIWHGGTPSTSDPTHTEKWVTYNDGLEGTAVHPTALSYKTRTDNRGCMSQNGSAALAHNGVLYPEILRTFYGEDLELDEPTPEHSGNDPQGNGNGQGNGPHGGGDDDESDDSWSDDSWSDDGSDWSTSDWTSGGWTSGGWSSGGWSSGGWSSGGWGSSSW